MIKNDEPSQTRLSSSYRYYFPNPEQPADLWEGCKPVLVVSGSQGWRETAAMVVEAVVSQFNTRWSTLLLSSSTASGLRHHQQHRSMTSQPHPGPCRPTCPHKSKGPRGQVGWAACKSRKESPISVFCCWDLMFTQLSFSIACLKFRPTFDIKVQQSTEHINTNTHFLFLRAN